MYPNLFISQYKINSNLPPYRTIVCTLSKKDIFFSVFIDSVTLALWDKDRHFSPISMFTKTTLNCTLSTLLKIFG